MVLNNEFGRWNKNPQKSVDANFDGTNLSNFYACIKTIAPFNPMVMSLLASVKITKVDDFLLTRKTKLKPFRNWLQKNQLIFLKISKTKKFTASQKQN